MKRIVLLAAFIALGITLATGCGGSSGKAGSSSKTAGKAYAPHIKPSNFTTKIDNKYFPLKPGTTFVYKGKTEDAAVRDEMAVTHDTKQIMGVKCVVVNDRVWENGKLTEQTFDWYAQDKKGNVWYLGEDSRELRNGKLKKTRGSWEADKDGAKPGIIMPAHQKIGQPYWQEYYKGRAEDKAQARSLNESVKVPYGSFDHVLMTKEWSPIEPGVVERKYYAAGVGDLLENVVKGPPERIELVGIRHE